MSKEPSSDAEKQPPTSSDTFRRLIRSRAEGLTFPPPPAEEQPPTSSEPPSPGRGLIKKPSIYEGLIVSQPPAEKQPPTSPNPPSRGRALIKPSSYERLTFPPSPAEEQPPTSSEPPSPGRGLIKKPSIYEGLIVSQPPAEKSSPLDRLPAVVPAPASVVLKKPTVIRVTEASRRQEPLHKEVRKFNNKNSSAPTEETIRVSYTARVSTSVGVNETRALSGNASVGFANVIGAQASLGNDLMRHYSLSMDDELTYEQTTKITVPAHAHIKLTLHWFRIWATGLLTISEGARRAAGEVAEVPYEITVALAYNPKTRDI